MLNFGNFKFYCNMNLYTGINLYRKSNLTLLNKFEPVILQIYVLAILYNCHLVHMSDMYHIHTHIYACMCVCTYLPTC